MGIFKEFKEFAVQGNAIDLAVGVVIGAAFGKITASLVGDILMPPLGLLISGIDLSQHALVLKAAEGGRPAVMMQYGHFLQELLDFTIVAFTIFLMLKGINRLKRPAPHAKEPVPPPDDVRLLTEIRDLLKAKNPGRK